MAHSESSMAHRIGRDRYIPELDGVVASGAFSSNGFELVLTLDTGGTVTIPVPSSLRAGAGAADGTFLFDMGAPDDTIGSDGDSYLDITGGRFYKKESGTWTLQYTIQSGGVMPSDHTRRSAISEDVILTSTEVNEGNSGTTQTVIIPTWTGGRRYLFIGVPTGENDISGVAAGGIDIFHAWERAMDTTENPPIPLVLEGHKWWRTINSQSDVASGATYTITE